MVGEERKGRTIQINVKEDDRIKVRMLAAQENVTVKELIMSAVDYYEKNVLNK